MLRTYKIIRFITCHLRRLLRSKELKLKKIKKKQINKILNLMKNKRMKTTQIKNNNYQINLSMSVKKLIIMLIRKKKRKGRQMKNLNLNLIKVNGVRLNMDYLLVGNMIQYQLNRLLKLLRILINIRRRWVKWGSLDMTWW